MKSCEGFVQRLDLPQVYFVICNKSMWTLETKHFMHTLIRCSLSQFSLSKFCFIDEIDLEQVGGKSSAKYKLADAKIQFNFNFIYNNIATLYRSVEQNKWITT